MHSYLKHYGFIREEDLDNEFFASPGQAYSGYPVGILGISGPVPLLPGHPANAYTYDYPVKFRVVPELSVERMLNGDPAMREEIIRAAKQLEYEGCRFITGDCGFFGHFQADVAAALHIPVALSSVVQAAWAISIIRPDQKIGILTADSTCLSEKLLKSCGVTGAVRERCYIYGAQNAPEFSVLRHCQGHYHIGKVRRDLIQICRQMLEEHPDTGAFVFECTDMPPHSWAIQKEIGLPIFDTLTLIDYMYTTVCHKPFIKGGFC